MKPAIKYDFVLMNKTFHAFKSHLAGWLQPEFALCSFNSRHFCGSKQKDMNHKRREECWMQERSFKLENNKIAKSASFSPAEPLDEQLMSGRRLLLNNTVYFIDVLAERPLHGDWSAVGTWRPQRQPVVQTSGFSGDEQIAEDAESDNEGEKNHGCYGETHKSSKTVKQEAQTQQEYQLSAHHVMERTYSRCITMHPAELINTAFLFIKGNSG